MFVLIQGRFRLSGIAIAKVWDRSSLVTYWDSLDDFVKAAE
jgi:hypothetical protein